MTARMHRICPTNVAALAASEQIIHWVLMGGDPGSQLKGASAGTQAGQDLLLG
jgi:hypothetical protein